MEQYTTEQLKALAFDNIKNAEIAQANIKAITQEIERREKEAPKESPKKK